MRKTTIVVLILVLISLAMSSYFYNQLPEQMASHWNTQGEVDDYMPKLWGLILMPLMTLGLLALFLVIPKIDPLKSNILKFMKYYKGFILLLAGFLFYLHVIIIAWNLGYEFVMIQVLAPALGFMFFYMGILVEKAKRNWFVGIRTPWTLSDTHVWEKTHKLAGKLFKVSGIITLLAVVFYDYAIWFILLPVLSTAIITVVYSYLEYQKLH